MRGLVPPPPGVLRLDVAGTIDAANWMTGWWMFVSSEETLSVDDYTNMLALLQISSTDFIVNVGSNNVVVNACRLSVWGSLSLELVHVVPGVRGLQGDALPGNEALCVVWQTGERGREGVALTYMPGFPGVFTDDSVFVNRTGAGTIKTQADNFAVQVNEHTAPVGHQLTLGVLHRARAGVPLVPGEFTPFQAVKSAQRISHRDGRLRSAGPRF
jgi:hypothetical protein